MKTTGPATQEVHVSADLEGLAREAARRFAELAAAAVTKSERFTVAFSGGSTPRGLYRVLAAPPFREAVPWPQVHCFWGDERCVPPDHPESNYRGTFEELLARVPVPPDQVHGIQAELPDPAVAADQYAATLARVFGLQPGDFPRLDLVLLGMGADGHTASLFPGTPTVAEEGRSVAAVYVERLKAHRVTLTPPVLRRARAVLFLVAGTDKAQTLREVLQGSYRPDRYPAQLLHQAEGRVTWLLDRPAASLLDHPEAPGGTR